MVMTVHRWWHDDSPPGLCPASEWVGCDVHDWTADSWLIADGPHPAARHDWVTATARRGQ